VIDNSKHLLIDVDVSRALEVLSAYVFAGPEACIRELIANAADSLVQLESNYSEAPEIRISTSLGRILTISDNGVGMTEQDVRLKLGTVFATSKTGNPDLIGRFGIGFYSCFPLCSKVEVFTKTHSSKRGVVALYEGGQSLCLSQAEVERPGTSINLYLKEEYGEFLDQRVLTDLVEESCDFIPFPIYIGHGWIPVNRMDAPWYHDASETDLREGLADLFDTDEILALIPIQEVGLQSAVRLSARGVLYIQTARTTPAFRLYCRRVLVTNSNTGIFDEALHSFISGAIDTPNVPLVLSRDAVLQKSPELEWLRGLLIARLAEGLANTARVRNQQFTRLMAEHGPAIKKASLEHPILLDELRDWFPYRSSLRSSVTVPQYLSRRKDNCVIYCDDVSVGGSLIPLYNQANIEVLYMTDAVDAGLRVDWEVNGEPVNFKRLDVDPPLVESKAAKTKVATDRSSIEMLRLLFKAALTEESLQVELRPLGPEGPTAVLAVPEEERQAMQFVEIVRIYEQQGRLNELPPEAQLMAETGILQMFAKFSTKTLILNESNEVVTLLIQRLLTGRKLTPEHQGRWSDLTAKLFRKNEPVQTSSNPYLDRLLARFLFGQAMLSSGLHLSSEKLTVISQSQTELIASLLRQTHH